MACVEPAALPTASTPGAPARLSEMLDRRDAAASTMCSTTDAVGGTDADADSTIALDVSSAVPSLLGPLGPSR